MQIHRTEVGHEKPCTVGSKIISNDSFKYLFLKRTLDVVLSLVGIIILVPLFIVVSILIKLEDPKGPVFFKQTRIGKDQRSFQMYKFRSMVSNAEELIDGLLEKNEVSGLMFKMKNDPRITKTGKFLRKTSIDELPQLINVLKGEMSLVGPRPPLKREVDQYSNVHLQRLYVKPGCTGVWQVSERNSVGFEEMVKMDLDYIESRSLILDLVLIYKTIIVMIRSRAY